MFSLDIARSIGTYRHGQRFVFWCILFELGNSAQFLLKARKSTQSQRLPLFVGALLRAPAPAKDYLLDLTTLN